MAKCIVCKGVFESKRADAVYCSDKCRKQLKRTNEPVRDNSVRDNNTEFVRDKPANFGQPDCQCRHCQNNRATGSKLDLNHGPRKSASELLANEYNRVPLPGDTDYDY